MVVELATLSSVKDPLNRPAGQGHLSSGEGFKLLQAIALSISEAPDFAAALESVLRQVCCSLGWSLGEAWTPVEDGSHLVCSPVWYAHQTEAFAEFRDLTESLTFAPHVGLPGRVWSSQQPEWHLDVSALTNQVFQRSQAALHKGLKAALGVPVLARERVLAVLVFFMTGPCSYNPWVVDLVSAVAAQLGTLMQLKQTEKALRHSETQFRIMFNSAAIGIGVTASNGVVIEANAAMQTMLGYTGEELRQMLFVDFTHPDDVAADVNAYNRVLAGLCDTYQLEKRYIRKDGLIYWGRLTVSSARTPNGDLLFTVACVENITERKQVERNLQEQEAFLRLILDNIPQHIFWKDTQFVYRGCNHTFARSVGLHDPQEVVGKTDRELWDEENAETYRSRDRQIIETGVPSLHKIRSRVRPDGSVLWRDISKVPIHDAEGNIIGILGTFEDITERKRAEEELARRERYLTALVHVQRQLLSSNGLDDFYTSILEPLGQAAGACRAYLFENSFNAEGQLCMSQRSEWCREDVQPQVQNMLLQNLPYDVACPRWAELLGQGGIISGSVSTFPKEEQEILSAQDILSVLVLPLIVHGQFFGFIGFDNTVDARPWTSLEVDLLQAAAAAIALIYERQRTETALRDSEQRYRLLAENSTDLISRHTPTGTYLYASPACTSLLGYAPEELLGHSLYQFAHPDDRTLVEQYYAAALGLPGIDVAPFSYRVRHHDGHYVWLETVAKAVSCPHQETVQEVIAVSRNVTERKRTENLLADQKQVLEMIAQGMPLDETLTVLIQCMESHTDGMLGSILLLDLEGEHLYRGIAPHLPSSYMQAVEGITIGDRVGSCGTAAHRGKPIITYDIATDPYWREYAPAALRHHLRSCWAIPIFSSQGKVLGTFALYSRYPRTPLAKDWQVIEIATQLAGIAIEHRRREDALRTAEAKYRSIFENAVEGIFQSTADGQFTTVNPMLARMYGYGSPDDLIHTLTDIEHQLYVDPERRREFVRLMQSPGSVLGFESQIYRKDGSMIWISECARAIYGEQGELKGYEGTVEDISQRKQTEAELHKRDRLLQGVAEATNVLLTNVHLESAFPQVLKILGTAAEADRAYIFEYHAHSVTRVLATSVRFEWTGETIVPLSQYAHCYDQPLVQIDLARWHESFQQGKCIRGPVYQFPEAERLCLELEGVHSVIMMPIFLGEHLWGFIGFDDCHYERLWSASEESLLAAIAASIGGAIKRQMTEEQMRHQAFHDSLTGLPNRTFFNHRLQIGLTHAQRSEGMLAVMFLDLDRFKTINDTLGHAVGDQLLTETTRRLMECLREEDTIARWGGDEFTVLLPSIKSPEDAAKVAQRISDALKPVFDLEGQELYISISIGIALYPENGADGQTLLKHADAALYRVKEQGRNHYQFYTDAMNSRASELLTLDNDLHHALERQEFVIYYQPQINVLTGQVTQMEALLRWQHPRLGLISPQTFIKLAEDNGMILPIGEWVLQTACTQNRIWHEMGLEPLRIAVNLSARQFQQVDLVQRVAQILHEVGLEPRYLELEITETAVMRDVEFTTAMLKDFRAMGVRIAMDDFGTGYSSLSYLKTFPLHTLKIDRSFIQDLAQNPEDDAITRAIITLAMGLNLTVVAEGVETSEQMGLLRSLRCTEMQGYWFSKPLDPEAATEFLQHHRTAINLNRMGC